MSQLRIALVALLALMVSAPAMAATTVYKFAGVCSDCSGTATGTLTLSDYTDGSAINSTNFVSFSYDGTDLLSAFDITAAQASYVNGSMSAPYPSAQNFYVIGNDEIFSSQSNGNWCVGSSCAADYGFAHTWAPLSTASAVPEPGSWALMILGFGTLGLALRRRPVGTPAFPA